MHIVNISKAIPNFKKHKSGGLVNMMSLREDDTWIGVSDDDRSSFAGLIMTDEVHDGINFGSFPQTKQYAGFYEEVSNGFFWPWMHGGEGIVPSAKALEDFTRINKLAAHHALAKAKPDSVFWVHDYQLTEVPAYIRAMSESRGLPTPRIGFFLHIPFPGPADFKRLTPKAREIAEGGFEKLFHTDLAGFQTPRDLANFQKFARRMGVKSDEYGDLVHNGRKIELGVFPASIDPEPFMRFDPRSDRRDQVTKDLLAEVGKRKLLLGVDRGDPAKGIVERLLAFELFLEKHPDMADKVVLLQVAPPTRMGVKAYRDYMWQMETISARINERFGTDTMRPVIFHPEGIERTQLPFFFREAAVMLVTSLRDGMNLVAKEFVASQDANNPGVLVLANMVGALYEMQSQLDRNPEKSERLLGALAIDPTNLDQSAAVIEQALNLPANTAGITRQQVDAAWDKSLPARRHDFKFMINKVLSYTAETWAVAFRAALTGRNVIDFSTRPHQTRVARPSAS